MSISETKVTAIHEAGHAAASIYFQVPFKKVTIVPDETTLGKVITYGLGKKIRHAVESGNSTDYVDRKLQQELIIFVAGPVASSKFTKQGLYRHLSNDYEKCFELIGNLFGNERIEAAYINYIVEETKALLSAKSHCWQLCKALSKELLKKETLRYQDCINTAKQHFTYLQ